MDDVSKGRTALKFAKSEPLSEGLWQQALQAGRQARIDEVAQREASATRQPHQNQDRQK